MTSVTVDLLREQLGSSYTVDDYLDRGGQGAVYRGTYAGESVAIKLFSPSSEQRRIDREIQVLATHDCPHLVRVRDHQQLSIAGFPVVMLAYEFHSGGDLRQFLQPGADRLSVTALARIGTCVSKALEFLWSRRIVHRDVKPANIVASGQGNFVLVDLGLAKHLDRSDITAAGLVPGTPSYMSPEQLRGRKSLTLSSDLFSLGVTLYELAAKSHPFAHNHQQTLAGVCPSLSRVRKDLPPRFCEIVSGLLHVVPSGRPSNVSDQLSRCIED